MSEAEGTVGRLAGFVHRRLLWLLVGSYALAALAPTPGLWLRSVDSAVLTGPGLPRVSLAAALLSFLLFSAGLGVPVAQLWQLARRPALLLVGVLGTLAIPVAFVLVMAATLRWWHNPTEAQEILVGLALVASMPVAGSAAAWSQHADGDLALSLGLVVFSTCLSPVTTPLALHAAGWATNGPYAAALHDLADGPVSGFLGLYVLAPSLLGIAGRAMLGDALAGALRPHLKLASSSVLLALCYANAAVALPGAFGNPDWDYLAVLLVIVAAMCLAGFAAGAVLGSSARAGRPQRASLMFGLGMTNNGTGLVIAGGALAHLPMVLLPIIFYNLVQHVVAGCVDRFWLGRGDEPGAPEESLPPQQFA